MEITDKTFFEEVIQSELPVLIEYWASWCVPCKSIEFILRELDHEYTNRVKIVKLNVDRNRRIPNEYDITGIPTFMTFKDGCIYETKVGAQSKKELILMVENVLK